MTAAFIDDDVNNPHISTLVFIVSIPNFDKFSVVPNFSANIGKPFPSPDDLEFSCYETLFPTYSCENPHLAFVSKRRLCVKIHFSFPVSRNLHLECHPVSSLENNRLDSGLCLASVSRYWSKHCPILSEHSPSYWSRSILAARFCSCSTRCEVPNSKVLVSPSPSSQSSASPSPNLLQDYIPVLSLTWHSAFCSKERNGYKRTSRNL